MAAFAWEGRTRGGEVRKGMMDVESELDVQSRLRQMGISVTRVRNASRDLKMPKFLQPSIGERELVVFTRQLATMQDAGLPITQSLEILGTQAETKTFGRILLDVKGGVEAGKSLSEAMRSHPRAFNELFVNLVAAGEAGGILDRILSRLAAYMEKAQALKRQVRGAMVYPVAILAIAMIVVFVLLWKVVPVFQAMFRDFGGAALPAPTQMVINISEGLQHHFFLIVLLIVGTFMGFSYILGTRTGKRTFDTIILKAPVFGSLVRKVAVARFTRTLGTLISSGVPLLDALDIVARTAGNAVVSDAILFTRLRISEGKNISEPLLATKVFPTMVVQMIGVGEQTGALDQMLTKIADFYEEEVDVAVGALTKLMEPLMMIVLGGIVGGLLIAMYAPIFEMAGNIKAQ